LGSFFPSQWAFCDWAQWHRIRALDPKQVFNPCIIVVAIPVFSYR
jgi:hypothetical protein